jgi:hypothetical protein
METEIDIMSFESAFGATVTTGGVYSIGSYSGIYSGVTYANPVIQNIITLYERDMRNVFEEYGKKQGRIICRLTAGEGGAGGYGWLFLSGLTLFVPNLLGMPLYNGEASMEVELSIFDNNDTLIGRYTSDYHKSKVPAALYHGYSNPLSKAAIDTFKDCITDIKQQIECDYDRLNNHLK